MDFAPRLHIIVWQARPRSSEDKGMVEEMTAWSGLKETLESRDGKYFLLLLHSHALIHFSDQPIPQLFPSNEGFKNLYLESQIFL